MIKSVSISAKGDYSKITFAKGEDSATVDMIFSKNNDTMFNGTTVFSCSMEDLLAVVSLLCGQEGDTNE